MNSPYLICEFSKATLSNLIRESFGSDFPDVDTKKQTTYLFNYLRDLKAETILLESDYIDKDYLEDHSKYYVKCFTNNYGERCARLHFFSHDFDHPRFEKVFEPKRNIKERSEQTNEETPENIIEALQENYLGFIVIKPLPKTFIGKTCLKLYDTFYKSEQRKVISRPYHANLFGIDLTVETVAFQEQDQVISACATTAVWCSLQALDKNDTRSTPSSCDITLAAINHIENSSNSFPNRGLTNKQILRALDIYGYRNHHIALTQVNEASFLRVIRLIKSYIDSGLPVILGVNVYSIDEETNKVEYIADHAITVLGYKNSESGTALYLHDDRLGPYARATIASIKEDFKDEEIQDIDTHPIITDSYFYLQEKNDKGEYLAPTQILIPDSLIVPNHKKVRISVELIDNTCQLIVDEYKALQKEASIENLEIENVPDEENVLKYELTYDIQLENVSKLKSRILQTPDLENKAQILTKSAARFLWSAKFYLNNELSLEVLFDSTDIPQGNAVTHILKYNEKYCKSILIKFYNLIKSQVSLPESNKKNFLSAFIRALKPDEESIYTYLDEQYGEPKAPIRLKKDEIANSRIQTQINIKHRYGREKSTLEELYPDQKIENGNLIWAISLDGALLIGQDSKDRGHPTLTGSKPARIAGELYREKDGWSINAQSGRYSSQYSNAPELLKNALQKFNEIFYKQNKPLKIKTPS